MRQGSGFIKANSRVNIMLIPSAVTVYDLLNKAKARESEVELQLPRCEDCETYKTNVA